MRLYHVQCINARYVSHPHVHRYTCIYVYAYVSVYVCVKYVFMVAAYTLITRESKTRKQGRPANALCSFFYLYLSSLLNRNPVYSLSQVGRSEASIRTLSRYNGLSGSPFLSLRPIPWSTSSHPPPLTVCTLADDRT